MKKTRVAAYCRASRGSAEPEHSLKAQADFYKEMICSTPSFQFAGIHAEIASGLNAKHRSEFRKLLQDCKKSKVEILSAVWIQSHDSSGNEPPFEYPLKPPIQLHEWQYQDFIYLVLLLFFEIGGNVHKVVIQLLISFVQLHFTESEVCYGQE